MSAASTSTTAVDSGNSGGALSERDAAMVVHSLQIPKCISPSGGNLSGFAAEVTALFWFESTKIIETAEQMDSLSAGTPVWPLSKNAVASAHFRKWVHTVLSTTQVTQNVILLALLFIYRLKIKNPSVNGRPGSEYRLLTVALMLGNKFLDDNTYTNKTWADVSGISVTEIHVMEVEFLSNMRYSLLASKEHWEDWLAKLARFKQYIDRAQLPPKSVSPTPSPTHRQFVSPLPSPTGNGPTLHPTPQSFHCNPYSPMSAAQTGNGSSQRLAVSHVMNNAVSPSPLALRPVEYGGNARKRGYPEEDPGDTTPAKRVNYGAQSGYFTQRQQPTQAQPPPQPVPAAQLGMLPQHQAIQQQVQHHMAAQQPRPIPAPKHQHHQPHQHQPHAPPRLSVPNLTINTNTYAPQQASALSLPPLVPGTRAMSTVYAYPGSSPIEAATAAYSHHAAAASGVHTPIAHSPSVYLQQRPSPYKPVRYVNTLLHPPPSAFLQQYHLCGGGAAPVPPANMHYQPLGRRNDVRTGVVPEFIVGPPPHQQQQQQYRGVPQQQQQPPQTTRPPMHPQPRPMPMQQPHYQGSY